MSPAAARPAEQPMAGRKPATDKTHPGKGGH